MTTYRYRDDRLEEYPGTPPEAPLRVADSWRCVDGRVRRFDRHRARFVASAAAAGPWTAPRLEAFVDAAAALAAGPGEWFPRVRLVGEELLVDVRPGPPRHETVTVAVLPPGDPRTNPRVKGPDLALAGDLVAAARPRAAGEVLVRDADGTVLECGWAALVWWEHDVLCVPDPSLPVLPSVTRTAVEDMARARGVEVRPVRATPADLDGRETWLLNAYQGLRLVTGWVDADLTPGPGVRFPTWRSALDADLAPLPDEGGDARR